MKCEVAAKAAVMLFSYFIFHISHFAPAHAADGAAFLKIDVDARSIGMGGAQTALAEGAAATHWNPAGLAGADRREASASHAEWFAGLTHQHAAYVHPRVRGGSLGVAVNSLRAGGIEARDANRQAAGSFSAEDTAFTLSYGKAFGATSLGMSAKVIEQRLGSHQARGAAMDVGLIRPLPIRNFTLGLAAQNIGPRMAYAGGREYDLPATLKAGLGYTPSPSFALAADVKYQPRAGETETAWGAEFRPVQALALRAGYQLPVINGAGAAGLGQADKFRGFQGGFGFVLSQNYRLDYAILPFGELGNTQRVSFSAKF